VKARILDAQAVSARMAAKGHRDAFLRPRWSVRYRFSQGILAGMQGNGRDAPTPDTRRSGASLRSSTASGPSGRSAHRW